MKNFELEAKQTEQEDKFWFEKSMQKSLWLANITGDNVHRQAEEMFKFGENAIKKNLVINPNIALNPLVLLNKEWEEYQNCLLIFEPSTTFYNRYKDVFLQREFCICWWKKRYWRYLVDIKALENYLQNNSCITITESDIKNLNYKMYSIYIWWLIM